MSNKLYKIIEDKYIGHEEIITLIKKYNLEHVIIKSIEIVESKFDKKEFGKIPNISGILLSNVNSFLGQITNPTEKKKIEYVLGDLFQEYLDVIAAQKNGNEIIAKIQENLLTACEIGNFDFGKLSHHLNLEKSQILPLRLDNNFIHYEWNAKDFELDELSKDMYDKKIIYSVKDFKKLFKPINQNLIVRCNPEKKEILIVMFQLFKDSQIIKPKGNSGHFAPIVRYCVDNEESFLFKKAANKIHYRLKKNESKYLKVKEIAHSLIIKNINMYKG